MRSLTSILSKRASNTATTSACSSSLTILNRQETTAKLNVHLILLDLHLSIENGLDLVQLVRAERHCNDSHRRAERNGGRRYRAYQAGVNACMRKENDLHKFSANIVSLMHFWVKTAELPTIQTAGNQFLLMHGNSTVVQGTDHGQSRSTNCSPLYGQHGFVGGLFDLGVKFINLASNSLDSQSSTSSRVR